MTDPISKDVALIIFYVITWVIVTIPVWLASKFFSKNSSFLRALLATFAAVIIFAIIYGIFAVIKLPLLGVLLGFIGILFVFKNVFEVGWLGALGIAIMTFIITIIISVILAVLLGIGLISILHIR